jgi:hypothetical protein
MKFSREWAMPNADTFIIKPIADFVHKYLKHSLVSIDPFARNKAWATHTNDLNPATSAQHHLDAAEFLQIMAQRGVRADCALFDPPYSPRQVSEVYASIGKDITSKDTQTGRLYRLAREALIPCLTSDAVVLSFGWNSVGMGKKNGFEQIEILLVCHGGAHNDTICLAERRIPHPLI